MNKFFITIIFLLGYALVYGQERILTGSVQDADRMPLIGASVVVKTAPGSRQIGSITNVNGEFKINLPEGTNTLIVSYVGYEMKEVDVSGLSFVNITLNQSAMELEDVVVTALGIKKDKKALGYAFSDVKGEELTTNRDVNFINSIRNKVAGVNISQTAGGAGTSSRIVIRGIKSLSTESQPLIVVDGVPLDNSSDGASWLGGLDYGNSLMNISPDDIETMSVLKGPNAAALYGSRAANGVIIITTKKGTVKDNLRVTFNSNIMFDRAYLVADYQNEYGAGYGGAIQKQKLSESQAALYGVDSAYYYYSTGSWGPKLDGTMEVLNWNGEFVKLTPQPDNVKDYFEKGYTLTNSIAIEKGDEKNNWRFSASDLQNKGLKPNSSYDRKTVNFNINSKLNDLFSLSFKGNYIREDAFNRVGQGDSRTGARTFIWMPRSININTLKEDYMSSNGYEQNWYFSDDWHTNPYWEAYKNYNDDFKDHFIGYAKVDFQLNSWLRAYVRSSMDTYMSKRFLRVANNALRANKEGSYTEQWVNFRSLNHDFLITGDKSLNDNWNANMNLGGNYYRYYVNTQSTTIKGLAVPDFFSLNNPKNPDETSTGTLLREKVIQSVYGSAQLVYKNWGFIELTARNDWSSTLPVSNNSYFYPSMNTSIVFSDALNINNKILSFGKIRFSYAFVGNDTDPYKLSREFINEPYGDQTTVYLSSEGNNANLKPEQTGSWEIGTDLRFFLNRIGIDFTYYNETTYDQIVSAEISKTSGFSSIITNGGKISNKGIEVQLNATPLKSQNFNWDIIFNFAKNKNTVVSLAEGLTQLTITNESQIDIVAIPGRPYGEIIGTRYKRYYNTDSEGNIIDDPNNGRPLIDESGLYVNDGRGVIGNITPDFTGGVSNSINYKNFNLSFSIGFSIGGDMFSKTNKYGKDNGQFVETLEGRESWYNATTQEQFLGSVGYVADGVLADGTENIRGIDPQVYWHQHKWGGIAELDVYDASYVKLRDLTLNYNFPEDWFSNNFLEGGSFALIGKNLWLIHSGVPHIDPESSFTSNNNGLGQEYAAMPTTRSIGFNLKLNF